MPRLNEFQLTLEYKRHDIDVYCGGNAWGRYYFTYTITNPHGQVLMTRAPFTYLFAALRDAIKVVDMWDSRYGHGG